MEQLNNHEAAIKWAVLGTVILGLEIIGSETLSNGVDRALEHPVGKYLAIGAVAVTGAHLLNIFEHFGAEHLDPFNVGFDLYERIRNKD